MQDRYVGDVGDYCKFCILRALRSKDIKRPPLSLGINWYRTLPEDTKPRKQDHGKFTQYSDDLQDSNLYKKLKELQETRNIKNVEESGIIKAKFYNIPVPENQNRELWHLNALKKLRGKDIVFLDPDNGIETEKMKAQKHVRLSEIEDYYTRGQSIIVYQHQPRIKKDIFIKKIFQSQFKSMKPDAVRVVEYSRYNCRFFILLLHKEHRDAVDKALVAIKNKPSKFCKVYLRAEDCNSAGPRSRRIPPQIK